MFYQYRHQNSLISLLQDIRSVKEEIEAAAARAGVEDSIKTETGLLSRTNMWRKLNYIRVGIFMLVSFGLIPILYMFQELKLGLLL